MAKHSIKGSIYGFVYEGKMSDRLHFQKEQMPAPFVKLCDHTIEVEIADDFDWREPAVAAMRQEIQSIKAEAHSQIVKIEGQISKLLALENAS